MPEAMAKAPVRTGGMLIPTPILVMPIRIRKIAKSNIPIFLVIVIFNSFVINMIPKQ